MLKFSPLCLLIALLPAAHAASRHHHAHTTHKSASASPFSEAKPVLLSAHPGTAQDADARMLNKEDLQDAARHHDTPIILLGSAPLSDGKDDEALFVQLQSARLCGSAGCATSVYLRHDGKWTTALDSINGDISVLPSRHHGMHDLLINKNDRWTWDGTQYQDTMSAPAIPPLTAAH